MRESDNAFREELLAGRKAASQLRRELRSVLGVLNIKAGSQLLRTTTVRAVGRFDALDHLNIITPNYIFMQHYGFEGIKKNGVQMTMRPYDHFNKLLDSTTALDKLADAIGEIRLDEVSTAIRF